ncbi:hypothetical protein BCF46_0442 [Litoreibacter meonggei]|uniref:Transferrin-binding protein B C-lobe/N-lobe beta barrel domain-containing protein n=1 Tax=Litoreibacter meonggei TaxID=1049199 RepID=A0A497X506_9RHOB|nr:hypothetical protein [Litoreibacter meonggei]RLJ60244.1 hypothetical protein BCF46_0442 [Litoreibacter meonggei]
MILKSAVKALGLLSISALIACGGSGSNPLTGGAADDGVITDPGTDPSTTDAAFLFDSGKNLVANSFIFTPGTTPGTGTISINNLPFDGVSSQGGAYTPRAGVTLPSGEVYQNTPSSAAEDPYFAVVLTSPNGTGALVGAVATNVYAGSGYGGAYASRTSRGLPATRPQAYIYNGSYNGIRVLRQAVAGSPNNTIQLTTGNAQVNIDLQDFDSGSIRGLVTGRRLYDLNGNFISNMDSFELVIADLDPVTLTTIDGVTNTANSTGLRAQTGTWTGLVSGPNGEEVVGFVLLEGSISDRDPSFDTNLANPVVTGRETGGFIATR